MPPRYGVHGALKNAKEENIFMIFSNVGKEIDKLI
jgi:hypothetical protein